PGPQHVRPVQRRKRPEPRRPEREPPLPQDRGLERIAHRLERIDAGPAEECQGHVIVRRGAPPQLDAGIPGAGGERARAPREGGGGGDRDLRTDEQPLARPHIASSISRRAHQLASVRTWSRAPGHASFLVVTPLLLASASQTVPTGLSGVPPSGP